MKFLNSKEKIKGKSLKKYTFCKMSAKMGCSGRKFRLNSAYLKLAL